MKIVDLTPAERRVGNAFPEGTVVDFTGAASQAERTVRAEVIRALLLGENAHDGEVAALRLHGASISGVLNLRYATVGQPINLRECDFEQPPALYGAHFRQLNLSGSRLPALDAATVRVAGVLRITDCRIPGEVRLGGARISGAFFLDRARLGQEAGDEEDRDAILQLNHATVGGDVWGPELTVQGQVRLTGATVGGAVNLNDADLSAPGGTALEAENLTVGTNVSARGLRTRGRVNLRGSTIPGQLDLTYARLCNPGGVALRASSCTIGELWLRKAAPIDGSVSLRRSHFDSIYAMPETWPTRVRLNDVTYAALAPPLPAEERLRLLERDEDGYVPHAYEQLTAAYRRVGDDAAARAVQLAKQRRHRATLSWYAKVWGYVQDATVGYGFRPTRAMAWLVALLALGSLVYGLHHPRPVEPGKAPDFNPVVYTLDLLLPIIDFGQEKAFLPHGGFQWLAYLLIAAGWILATTVVAGVTRAVSR
jgi:hypothetical protein